MIIYFLVYCAGIPYRMLTEKKWKLWHFREEVLETKSFSVKWMFFPKEKE